LPELHIETAAELDRDPSTLELWGLSREDLHKELAKNRLYRALSAELQLSLFTKPAESLLH
jgi:hypothetical protein